MHRLLWEAHPSAFFPNNQDGRGSVVAGWLQGGDRAVLALVPWPRPHRACCLGSPNLKPDLRRGSTVVIPGG